MNEPIRCRSGRHYIRTSQDLAPNKGCRFCQRLVQARYRHALQESRRLLKELAAQ